jgi:succinate dehydrogenase/fumarate reductase flavoprotein subunit
MWEKAGPFRTRVKLCDALERLKSMRYEELPYLSIGSDPSFNLSLQDWFELRAMLIAAEAVVTSALAREESRGAHQREDFPEPDESLLKNQVLELSGGELVSRWTPPVGLGAREVSHG